jgi:hypothetical protein
VVVTLSSMRKRDVASATLVTGLSAVETNNLLKLLELIF